MSICIERDYITPLISSISFSDQ